MSAEGQIRAPDAAEIERLARAAMARLPHHFALHLAGVVLRVEDFAEDEVLDELGIESAFDLLGLYTGRPIGTKSVSDVAPLPDMIHLYRRPLLEEWIEGGETLEALVTHVVIHEVGHHFGLSDADMEAIERGMA
jgi:predicted Zn-dependent protease with MMP-like domain